jgi:hypothetical protein
MIANFLAWHSLIKILRLAGYYFAMRKSHRSAVSSRKIINCFRKLQSPLTTGIKTAAIGNKLHVFFDQSKKFEECSSNAKNLQESSNDNDRIGSDARKSIIAKK